MLMEKGYIVVEGVNMDCSLMYELWLGSVLKYIMLYFSRETFVTVSQRYQKCLYFEIFVKIGKFVFRDLFNQNESRIWQ